MERFKIFGLELHPDKAKITVFDFLGFTLRPRGAKNNYGEHFINFLPAVSDKAKKAIRKEVRNWRLQLKADKKLEDLVNMSNSKFKGGRTITWNFTNLKCPVCCATLTDV